MANQSINQLLTVLQKIKTDASNLKKDVDERDEREETRGDISNLFKGFGELKAIMSKLEQGDIEKLQGELKELMGGEETFLEYQRDVNAILMEVQKRTEKSTPIKDKIQENFPTEKKDETVGSLFSKWQGVLSNVQKWVDQSKSHR